MQIKEIMSRPVIVVSETDTLEEVAQTLLNNNIGGVPVVGPTGQITGIITESDFGAKERSIPFSTFRSAKVLDQWLSGNQLERIYEADEIEKAAELMLKYDITRLLVVRVSQPVGIIGRRDLVKLMLRVAKDKAVELD